MSQSVVVTFCDSKMHGGIVLLCVGSSVVKGIVCRKNVAHKRMTSRYKNPRLLLLGGALEYQRVSNQLSSLDTLINQVRPSAVAGAWIEWLLGQFVEIVPIGQWTVIGLN